MSLLGGHVSETSVNHRCPPAGSHTGRHGCAPWWRRSRDGIIVGMTSIPLTNSPPRRLGLLPSARQMGHDALYLAAGLPVGVAAFSVIVTGLALAAGLAITLVGIPVLVATLFAMRGIAHLERRRAGALLGERVTDVERSWRGGPWQTTKAATTDPVAWRDVAWSLLLLPVGTAGFTVAVTLWSTALGFVTSPLWYWALPDDDPDLAFLNDPSAPWAALRVLTGLVLIPVAYLVCRGLATGTARLGLGVLGGADRRTQLRLPAVATA